MALDKTRVKLFANFIRQHLIACAYKLSPSTLFPFSVVVTTLHLRPMVVDRIYYRQSALMHMFLYVFVDTLARRQCTLKLRECGTKGKFHFHPSLQLVFH